MVNKWVAQGDQVGWYEAGLNLNGTVTALPNDMGEFTVELTDDHGNVQTRALNIESPPTGFVDFSDQHRTSQPARGTVTSDPQHLTVITKPQKQSLWPYLALAVGVGAVILYAK